MSVCGAAAAVIAVRGFRVGRPDQDVSLLGQEGRKDLSGPSGFPPADLNNVMIEERTAVHECAEM